MDKISSCPFCGGEAESKMYLCGESRKDKTLIWRFYVFCTECGAVTDNMYPSEEEAIAAWNRRIPQQKRTVEGMCCMNCANWRPGESMGAMDGKKIERLGECKFVRGVFMASDFCSRFCYRPQSNTTNS